MYPNIKIAIHFNISVVFTQFLFETLPKKTTIGFTESTI